MRQFTTTIKLSTSLFCGAAYIVVSASAINPACAQERVAVRVEKQRALQEISPLDCYRNAWQAVKDKFYEPTYNGQNWSRWEHKYESQIRDIEDANLAISTMIASLGDKDSYFLPASHFSDEKNQIVSRFCGVGLLLGLTESGKIEVRVPISRTPAFRAGLQTGDEIVAINHSPVPLSIDNAVHLIRGPKKTRVTLTIRRGDQRKNFRIIRDEIPVFCVFDSRMLDKEIGYIRIETLISLMAMDDILENLSKLSSAKGIILDLRGSAGGTVETAVDFSTVFLEKGSITTVVDRNGETKSLYKVDKQRIRQSKSNSIKLPLFQQPLVVLIDGSTSGSVEILTGALKDNQRAELVGEKTCGRRKAGGIFRLPNGAGIHLSMFRYLTPLNTDVMLGVEPHYPIALSEEDKFSGGGPWYTYGRGTTVHGGRNPTDGRDIQLATACKVMRNCLERLKEK